MKVLVISHTYIAPINRKKWEVLGHLYNDVELTVIFPKKWPGKLFTHEADDLSSTYTINRCRFIALDTYNAGNETTYSYHMHQLFFTIKSIRPEIIHVEQGDNALSYFQAIMCAKILRLSTKFLFFTWINWRPQFSLKYRLLWSPITRFNIKNSHGAITGNKHAQALLEEKNIQNKILVLPQLGVDLNLFNNTHDNHTNNSREQKKTILYLGRLVEEKGIFLLLHAFVNLSEKFPNWQLRFIGSGPSEKQLLNDIKKIQKYACKNRITHEKTIAHESIAQVLKESEILVLPSYDTINWREQFGHVLIEAMSCGVAVVGSDAGEIPNVIADAGLIFEQKNKDSLLAQLQALMQDDELRKAYGKKGRERVEKYYSHEAIAAQTYTYWNYILKQNAS